MNIRRVIRLSCLSVMGLFWASCGSDSDSSTGVPLLNPGTDPDSSSDALLQTSSSAEPNSADAVPESSSSDDAVTSSSDVEESSSSNDGRVKLSRDPSVTCTVKYTLGSDCLSSGSSEPSYSCMQLQEFLAKDTTVSQKILDKWEEKLMSCGAVQEPEPVYGIVYTTCQHVVISYLDDCTDGKGYDLYGQDDGIAYITKAEYDEVHSSSSVAESSSSAPEDLVTNCPRDSFAMFVDVLADVQKGLYEEIVEELDKNDTLPEAKRAFLDSIINREEKTLRGNLYPYQRGQYYGLEYVSLKYDSECWFNGYIAKTKTCADGTPETTELYREKYEDIFWECLNLIEKQLDEITE
ncbi:MAG: hypothetical protein IJ734_04010 [Fibrobacter sp.]|nr:hypothetical protein [Fibrobacter sp.]